MQGRGRKRVLSEEEIELWARVTRYDEPLARAQTVCLTDTRPKEADTFAVAVAPSGAEKTVSAKPAIVAARSLPAAVPPPHAPFDPRIGKKIARGRHPSTRGSIFMACGSRMPMSFCAASLLAARRTVFGTCLSSPAKAASLTRPRHAISGRQTNGAFCAGWSRNGLPSPASACMS